MREALASGGGGAAAGGVAGAQQPLPDFSKWGEIERKPMSNIRRKTAEHLSHAWHVIPHVTQHDKADITALEELRKKYVAAGREGRRQADGHGDRAEGPRGRDPEVPAVRLVGRPARRGQLVYKKYAHIGVAVDTDRGLLVPSSATSTRRASSSSRPSWRSSSEKARAGKLTLDEMSGGVITITNLGGIGGVGFTPIVNWPEVAILGISRGSVEPVWDGTQFEPRLMLPLSLSYDHRVIDGADAARFLRWVAEAFEQPVRACPVKT